MTPPLLRPTHSPGLSMFSVTCLAWGLWPAAPEALFSPNLTLSSLASKVELWPTRQSLPSPGELCRAVTKPCPSPVEGSFPCRSSTPALRKGCCAACIPWSPCLSCRLSTFCESQPGDPVPSDPDPFSLPCKGTRRAPDLSAILYPERELCSFLEDTPVFGFLTSRSYPYDGEYRLVHACASLGQGNRPFPKNLVRAPLCFAFYL